jgi:polyisoprenoid-binding protein YceI
MLSRSLFLSAALSLASMSLHATTYTLDPRHTQGTFSWNHLGFSNPSAQFSLVGGSLQFDPADPTRSSVKVTVPLANMSAGVPELDNYLHEADFFDIGKFPTATFTSTRVENGSAPGRLKVAGELTLRGVAKPIVLDVTVNKIGTDPRFGDLPMAGFEATTTLKRSAFGLGKYVGLVSDEIRIHITCQAIEAKAYAKQQQASAEKGAADAAQQAALAKTAQDDAAYAERDAAQQATFAAYAIENAAVAESTTRKTPVENATKN